jgi:hypothetical protein
MVTDGFPVVGFSAWVGREDDNKDAAASVADFIGEFPQVIVANF